MVPLRVILYDPEQFREGASVRGLRHYLCPPIRVGVGPARLSGPLRRAMYTPQTEKLPAPCLSGPYGALSTMSHSYLSPPAGLWSVPTFQGGAVLAAGLRGRPLGGPVRALSPASPAGAWLWAAG